MVSATGAWGGPPCRIMEVKRHSSGLFFPRDMSTAGSCSVVWLRDACGRAAAAAGQGVRQWPEGSHHPRWHLQVLLQVA